MDLEFHKHKEQSLKKAEIEAVQEQDKQFKFLHSFQKRSGLTLFEYNTKTDELSKTIITSKAYISIDGESVVNHQVIHNPDCVYFYALNMKNAKKKVNKYL